MCIRDRFSIAPFGGSLRRITSFMYIPHGIAWSGDDKRLVISQGGELDDVGLSDGSLRRIDLPDIPTWPAISRQGDKLAFSCLLYTSLWDVAGEDEGVVGELPLNIHSPGFALS